MENGAFIQEQIASCRQFAGEYNTQVYDREHWEILADTVRKDCPHVGSGLELACGTGLWTQRLLAYTDSLTAVDASPEMHALRLNRIDNPRVTRDTVDIFNLDLNKSYDLAFAAFWLSHVPMERFESFWAQIATPLKPNGHLLIVDSHSSGARGSRDTRQLTYGHESNINKVDHGLMDLGNRLDALGWDVEVKPITGSTIAFLGSDASTTSRCSTWLVSPPCAVDIQSCSHLLYTMAFVT